MQRYQNPVGRSDRLGFRVVAGTAMMTGFAVLEAMVGVENRVLSVSEFRLISRRLCGLGSRRLRRILRCGVPQPICLLHARQKKKT